MSRRSKGLLAVATAFVLVIGALVVRSAVGSGNASSSGALFGAFVQPGPTTGPDRQAAVSSFESLIGRAPRPSTTPATTSSTSSRPDGYNRSRCPRGNAPWRSFTDIFSAFQAFGAAHGKRMIVAEWGAAEDPSDPGREASRFSPSTPIAAAHGRSIVRPRRSQRSARWAPTPTSTRRPPSSRRRLR